MTHVMLRSRLLDLTPRRRHSQGFGGTWDGIGALLALVVGVALLARGQMVGLLCLAGGPVFARAAFLKYRAGNWP
jgi:hypothetical protein